MTRSKQSVIGLISCVWAIVIITAITGLRIEIFGSTLLLYRIALPIFILSTIYGYKELKGEFIDLIKNRTIRKYIIFLGLWILWSVVSLIWVKDYANAFRNIYFLMLGCGFILFIQIIGANGNKTGFYVKILSGTFILFILLAIYEASTGNHLPHSIFYNSPRKDLRYRPTSFFANPNDFGAFLSLYVWLIYSYIESHKSTIAKIGFIGLFIVAAGIIILTGSRMSIFALAVQISLLIVFNAYEAWKKIRRSRLLLTGAVVFLVFFMTVNHITSFGVYYNRMYRAANYKHVASVVAGQAVSLAKAIPVVGKYMDINIRVPSFDDGSSGRGGTDSSGEGSDNDSGRFPIFDTNVPIIKETIILIGESQRENSSMNVRINLIKNSMIILRDSRFMGVGAGNIERYLREYEGEHHYTTGKVNVHNWWIEILVNYGVIIFALYVSFYLHIIYVVTRIYLEGIKNGSRRQTALAKSFVLILMGFGLASISPSSIMAFRPVWILFGAAIVFIGENFDKKDIETESKVENEYSCNFPHVSETE